MDKVKMQGILEKGYGIIPKMIMIDKDIKLEAKAIYGYLASYAGNGMNAFPSIERMLSDLGVTRKRFYKYRKQLVDKGYITVEQRRDGRRRINNLYTLNTVIDTSLQGQFDTVQNETVQNDTTNNNNLNNNNLNNNSVNNNNYNKSGSDSFNSDLKEVIGYYEKCGFGICSLKTVEFLESDIELYGLEWTKEAMDLAIKSNKAKLSYVEGILKNWKANGKEERKEQLYDFNRADSGKNVTEWADKEVNF